MFESKVRPITPETPQSDETEYRKIKASKEISNGKKLDYLNELNHGRKIENKIRSKYVYLVCTLLSFATIAIISLFQYEDYKALIEDRYDYINSTKSFCGSMNIATIDLISTPIAIFLILFYMLLFKRRTLFCNTFKYKNVGLPMIVSCWNKSDRMFSAFTYGLIAFSVFGIVKYSINSQPGIDTILVVNDPSGFIKLLYQILQMFLIGVRYYPVLVGELY
jgi:hypothetical protein